MIRVGVDVGDDRGRGLGWCGDVGFFGAGRRVGGFGGVGDLGAVGG